MNKKSIIRLFSLSLLLFSSIFLSSCKKSSTATVVETDVHFNIHQYEKKVIASIPEKAITVYATNQTDETYKGLTLKYKGEQKLFKWECVTNSSYPPKLVLCDLNNDGEDELSIIIIKSYNKSSFISEAHIIKLSNMEEEKIMNPLDIINSNVQTLIDKDNITISYKNSKFVNQTKKILDTNETIYDNVHFGNIINYSIQNCKLIAEVPAQITNTKCIGNIAINYAYSDGTYILDELTFKANNN